MASTDNKETGAFWDGNYAVSQTFSTEQHKSTKGTVNIYCNKCTKKVIINKYIECELCGSSYHIKCFTLSLRQRNYNYFNICHNCSVSILPFSNLYGSEFHEALFEFQYTPYDIKNYASLSQTFRDIDFKYSCRESSDILKDIDPDQNDSDSYAITNCKYYFPSDLTSINSNQFSIFHLNIRSLRKNFGKLKTLLDITKQNFDVIALSETWLSDQDNHEDYNINGYQLFSQNRQKNDRGGVCVYVKESTFDSHTVDKLSHIDDYNHIFTLKLVPKPQETRQRLSVKLFTVCYRSPDSENNSFLQSLIKILSELQKTNKRSYIVGDVNYNILNMEHHKTTQDYYNLMTTHMYKQIITRPTRITDTSATLIDHIWHNDMTISNRTTDCITGIIYSDMSDHLPTFMLHKAYKLKNIKIKISYRQFTSENFTTYKESLSNLPTTIHTTDINKAHQHFCNNIVDIINKSFPIKQKSVRYKTLQNKWLNNELLSEIKFKNRLYAKKLKSPTEININNYRIQLKKVEKLKKIQKRDYYCKQLDKYNNNIKKRWTILREIMSKSQKTSTIGIINNNDELISDKNKISQVFVDYFQNIGSSLAYKFENISNRKFQRWLYRSPRPPENLIFSPLTPVTVEQAISELDVSKGAGIDEISPKLLKEGKTELKYHLTNLFNMSLMSGVFPECHKLSRCIPIFKGNGDKTSVKNYRPISIITSIGKLFEKLVSVQLNNHLTHHKIICENQHGFRKNRSVQSAILDFTDKINNALDNKKKAVGIFLDLSKAFDTVNHNILSEKLEYYGCSGKELNWFNSYLTNRSIQVNLDINNKEIDDLNRSLSYGVPQGSILGPVLFLLYINDIIHVSNKLHITLYADDTNLLMTGDRVNDILKQCNVILQDFDEYFKANKLTINSDKTKYMIFNRPYNKMLENDNFINKNIKLNRKKKKRKIKYPCGECKKQVRVDALICDSCKLWYHRPCIPNMTKRDMLKIANLYPDQWTCHNCIRQILPIGLIEDEKEQTSSILTLSNTASTKTCKRKTKQNVNKHETYINLKFDNIDIERVTNIKFLGVILTDTLTWNDHMSYVCTKMNKNIGYFYKCRQILNQEQLINLYNSFVEPYITYCLPIWGGYVNSSSTTNPITKTINRFKRIITYSKRTHIANTKIKLSSLQDYYTIELAKTAYKHILQPERSSPIYHETMTLVANTQDTRACSYKNLILPKYNTNYVRNSFKYRIASTWNSLPYPVKLKDTYSKFNDAIKRYVLEKSQ